MPPVGGWNPLQNEELKVPLDYEWLKDLTKTAGGDTEARSGAEEDATVAPFNRMVDAWLIAIALGTHDRDDPVPYDPPEHRFEYGARLHNDEDAIAFLHHVALAELVRSGDYEGNPDEAANLIVENPRRVIEICNDLAARGFQRLRDMTEEGSLPPLANLLRALNDEVAVVGAGRTDSDGGAVV